MNVVPYPRTCDAYHRSMQRMIQVHARADAADPDQGGPYMVAAEQPTLLLEQEADVLVGMSCEANSRTHRCTGTRSRALAVAGAPNLECGTR